MTGSKSNAVHQNITRDEEIRGSTDRAFGMVFTAVLLIVGLLPLMISGSPRTYALIIAAK